MRMVGKLVGALVGPEFGALIGKHVGWASEQKWAIGWRTCWSFRRTCSQVRCGKGRVGLVGKDIGPARDGDVGGLVGRLVGRAVQ